MDLSIGEIYAMNHPDTPGEVKIGCVWKEGRTANDRLNDANKDTWTTPNWKIVFSKRVFNPNQKEGAIHSILSEYRKHPKREIFTVSIDRVKMIFDIIDSPDIYTRNNCIINELHRKNIFDKFIKSRVRRVPGHDDPPTYKQFWSAYKSWMQDNTGKKLTEPELKIRLNEMFQCSSDDKMYPNLRLFHSDEDVEEYERELAEATAESDT